MESADSVHATLRADFLDFVGTAGSRAPLYARLAAGIAESELPLAILAQAPAYRRIPVTLLAAIHDVLLADPNEELASWYANLTERPREDDPIPVLLDFCARHRARLSELVTTRTPQTNEIGRSAVLLVGLAQLGEEVGSLAHLDVGASAGLNLLVDRYAYDYDGHRIGDSDIVLGCAVRGRRRPELLPTAMPRFGARLGLDQTPVDVTDPEQVRWVEACVWPDQTDRFTRLRLAMALAEQIRPEVVAGDAVTDLEVTLGRLGAGHPVVTTSWVLNYLGPQGQSAFASALSATGAVRDLSWVMYESPEVTPGLDWPQSVAAESLSVLRVVRWRKGQRQESLLATGHPHGYWLTWLE
jgi:hypothetical protein